MPSNLVLQAFLIRFSCFLACTAEIIREISDGLSGGARGIIPWAAAGGLPQRGEEDDRPEASSLS
jgi:hypothetical protein